MEDIIVVLFVIAFLISMGGMLSKTGYHDGFQDAKEKHFCPPTQKLVEKEGIVHGKTIKVEKCVNK